MLADIAVDYDWSGSLASDEIIDALDYAAVASAAIAFAEKTQFHLMESLVHSIIRHLLTTFPVAMSIDLKLQKNPEKWSKNGVAFSCRASGRRSLAILGLGSNLGDKKLALNEAAGRIGAIPHCRLLRSSSLHHTAPLLRTNQPEFFNQSLLIETLLSPTELLTETQSIESAMGRLRSERYGPRTIDIDLLLFEGFTSSSTALTVPHHGLRSRRFWIEELADIGLRVVPEGETVLEQLCEKVADGVSHLG